MARYLTHILCLVLQTASIAAQTKPGLSFHFVVPNSGRTPQTLDVELHDMYGHLFFTMICKSPDNEVTVRINPQSGSIDLIDENRGLSNSSAGAKSCLSANVKSPVKCRDSSFCSNDNDCVATLSSACPSLGAASTWQMTQYFDVTVTQAYDGSLAVLRCYAFCHSYVAVTAGSGDDQAISDLAVGFIVAGVILFAALLIISVVAWKIRSTHHLQAESEGHQKNHHIEYAK
ncbi:uncharacterized protein LOC129921761 [Biomphalaria glabrata]|uniref:Uncharacterized protein LOC129921761 n=1 Tax=Biomphalaria glabrata TaxID=6526 RepID=A0A9W2YCM3_BIOGL|nr:uncharacterized protein LOC129921761 [Biomphalaria glabrata]